MNTAEDWLVILSGSKHDGETQAEARLAMSGGAHLTGHGTARCNPADET